MRPRFTQSTLTRACLAVFFLLCLMRSSCASSQALISQPGTTATQSDISTTPAATTLSMYDGTYGGVFNYQWGGGSNPNIPWSRASMTVTMTLDSSKQVQSMDGEVILDITNVIIDDPAFGTGPEGVTPVSDPSVGASVAILPVDPGNPQKKGLIISIYLPNGASVFVSYSNPGDVSISPDGQTLSGLLWVASAYKGHWAPSSSSTTYY